MLLLLDGEPVNYFECELWQLCLTLVSNYLKLIGLFNYICILGNFSIIYHPKIVSIINSITYSFMRSYHGKNSDSEEIVSKSLQGVSPVYEYLIRD